MQRPGVIVERKGTVVDLLDPVSGEATALSPAAADLWLRFDGSSSVGDLSIELGHPLAEVVELVRRLRASGLAGDA